MKVQFLFSFFKLVKNLPHLPLPKIKIPSLSYLSLGVLNFDDRITSLCTLGVPPLVSSSDHSRGDADHRLEGLEVNVIHTRNAEETVLDSKSLFTALECLHILNELLVGDVRLEVGVGSHLGSDVAAERIPIDVVKTFNTDNAVIHEHDEKEEKETAELEVRPVAPHLTKLISVLSENNVVDEQVGNPDASATETFKNGSKNSRSVLSNEHTKEVVAKDNRGVEETEAKDLAVVEEHVKSLKSLLTSIVLRDVRSEAEKNGARDGTPHTLKTDDQDGVKNDLLQKVLLNDDLGSLNDLSDNHKSAAKSNLTGGSVFAAGGRVIIRADLGKIRAVEGSECDDDKSEGNNANTSPVRSMELTLKEELGEESREDNHGTTEHLPDGGSDPQKTNVHHSSSTHITESRSAHNAVLLPDSHLLLGGGSPGTIRIHKRLNLRNLLLGLVPLLCTLDATHDLIHCKTAKHTDEHGLSLEPRLLELLGGTVLCLTVHGKNQLLDNYSAGTEGKHTRNHDASHVTHLP